MFPAMVAILIAFFVIAAVMAAIVMALVMKIAILCLLVWVIYRAFFKPGAEYYQVIPAAAVIPEKRSKSRPGLSIMQFVLGLMIALYLVGGIRFWNVEAKEEPVVSKAEIIELKESLKDRIKTVSGRGRDVINEIKSSISQKNQKNKLEQDSKAQSRNIIVKSEPCASEEKARLEFNEQLREVIRQELSQGGAVNDSLIEQALKIMAIKPGIITEFKEVAGEKYPIYTANAEINLNSDFRNKLEKAMRLNIMADARGRVNLLFDLSVVVFIGLGLSNLLFRRKSNAEAA